MRWLALKIKVLEVMDSPITLWVVFVLTMVSVFVFSGNGLFP